MTVNRLLKKVVYAGYVEAPKWDVSAFAKVTMKV